MSSGGAISDEEWERFLRDAEAGAPGAPEEPSARARMVARRLREEPDRATGWRVHEPRRPRERKKIWFAIGLPVAAALLVVALAPGWVAGLFGGGIGEEGGKNSSPPGPVTNSQAAAQRPTADEPFRGSPAAWWADGKAGIRLPQALARSRDFLVASSLDPKVLRGEHPARASELINPRQRDVQQYLKHAFREPSDAGEADAPGGRAGRGPRARPVRPQHVHGHPHARGRGHGVRPGRPVVSATQAVAPVAPSIVSASGGVGGRVGAARHS